MISKYLTLILKSTITRQVLSIYISIYLKSNAEMSNIRFPYPSIKSSLVNIL